MTNPQLKLFNTLTREKKDFIPLDPTNIRMYVCGITPYDEPHIGNARVMVVFDILYRLLTHLQKQNGGKVTYASNFTDIDDKIINRARENGEDPVELADRIIESFHQSMDKLNVLRPTEEPRVSQYIPQIITMVDELVANGYAYTTPMGDVMYRSQKFPSFGELAHRKLDEQQHGARVKADDEKESPNDFVLWKANAKSATKMEQAFDPAEHKAKHFSALGRPGWHIECSAMSRQLLGDTFDIHGGGEDLQFPHHSCEIAQTEALTHRPMCQCWMHAAFITVGGKRMGKSEGNFTTIRDALQKYSPEAIRLWLLQTHYRKPVDFTDEALNSAQSRIARYKIFFNEIKKFNAVNNKPAETFISELSNDLDTANALAWIDVNISTFRRINEKNREQDFLTLRQLASAILSGLNILGIEISSEIEVNEAIQELLRLRIEARENKNWAESDSIRKALLEIYSIIVEDGPNGQTWRRL